MKQITGRVSGWWRVVVVAGAVACGLLLVSACGSSGSSAGSASSSAASSAPASSAPASSPAPNATVCQDVAALRASVSKLTDISISRGAVSTLTTNLKDVQAKLTTLATNAGTLWSTQVGALTSALSKLQTAVTGLTSGGSLSSVTSALGSVRTAAQNLFTAASAGCPSATASP